MNVYLYNKNAIGMKTLAFTCLTEFEYPSDLFSFALFFENEKGDRRAKTTFIQTFWNYRVSVTSLR